MATSGLNEKQRVSDGNLKPARPGSPRYPAEPSTGAGAKHLLDKAGKALQKNRKEIDHTTRYISAKFPIREGTIDLIGTAYNVRFTFCTYHSNNTAYLDLYFLEEFDESIGAPWRQVKTII